MNRERTFSTVSATAGLTRPKSARAAFMGAMGGFYGGHGRVSPAVAEEVRGMPSGSRPFGPSHRVVPDKRSIHDRRIADPPPGCRPPRPLPWGWAGCIGVTSMMHRRSGSSSWAICAPNARLPGDKIAENEFYDWSLASKTPWGSCVAPPH